MNIFLDVGAHRGQTLAAVQEREFDIIHCFEPVKEHWPELERIADPKRTLIERFGLWNRDASVELFDPGTKGAGMWLKDRRRPDLPITRELCEFRRASEWFRVNIPDGARVYLKLNCEGCECDILDDLLDSGEWSKVSFALVSFDVRKIGPLRHRMQEVIARLPSWQVTRTEDVPAGSCHLDRILYWLDMLPA